MRPPTNVVFRCVRTTLPSLPSVMTLVRIPARVSERVRSQLWVIFGVVYRMTGIVSVLKPGR